MTGRIILLKYSFNISFYFAPTIEKVDEYPSLTDNKRFKYICIHVGTNNLKYQSPDEMMSKLEGIFNKAKEISQKILVGTIIPRCDEKSMALKAHIFNPKLLEKSMEREDFVICDNNVRDGQSEKLFAADGIHLNMDGTKIFTADLKVGICKLLGISVRPEAGRVRSPSPNFNPRWRRNKSGNYGSFRH